MVSSTLKLADSETAVPPAVGSLVERLLISEMVMNALVSLDPSQLLAAAGRVGARALLEPRLLAAAVGDVGRELAGIALGRSQRAPEAGDRRWSEVVPRGGHLFLLTYAETFAPRIAAFVGAETNPPRRSSS